MTIHTNHGRPDPRRAASCAHHEGDAFDILETCHDHIRQRLERLQAVAEGLRDDGTFDEHRLAMLTDVIAFLDTAIPIHTADEESTLFPLLRRHPEFKGVDNTPMDCMEMQHRVHQDARRDLDVGILERDAAATARAAMNIVVEYSDHMRREEEILYPMARRLVTEPVALDWMADEMRARRAAAGLTDC